MMRIFDFIEHLTYVGNFRLLTNSPTDPAYVRIGECGLLDVTGEICYGSDQAGK